MNAPAPERQTLRPSIGRAGFFALAFGSMIGVAWVTMLGKWLTTAGPMGAVLGFAAGGLLMVCIGLCYAELCAMLPVAAGSPCTSHTGGRRAKPRYQRSKSS